MGQPHYKIPCEMSSGKLSDPQNRKSTVTTETDAQKSEDALRQSLAGRDGQF